MRPRSRGISCHSFDELLENCSSQSLNNLRPNRQDYPDFIDIQSYLQSQQQHNNNFTQDHQYFFFEVDQIRAEEEEQLDRNHLHKFIQSSIVLVCPSLQHILAVLLSPTYIASLSQDSHKINQETLLLSGMQSKYSLVCPAICTQLEQSAFALQSLVDCASEIGSKLSCIQNTESQSQAGRDIPLQLVIYNNFVYSQVPSAMSQQPVATCLYQHKIWLIQQQQQYSQLQAVYLNKFPNLFTVSATNGQLYLKQTTALQIASGHPSSTDVMTLGSKLKEIEAVHKD